MSRRPAPSKQLGMFAAGPAAIEEPVSLMVWDDPSGIGRVAPARVEERRNGLVRLRVERDLLLLGEGEVADRERLARDSVVWDRRGRRSA